MNVGDKVRIKKSNTSLPTPPMLIGKVGRIIQVRKWGLFEYRVRLDAGESYVDNWLLKRDEVEKA